MLKHPLLVTAIATGLLAGCGAMDRGSGSSGMSSGGYGASTSSSSTSRTAAASSGMETYRATLSASAEVPPNQSPGTGSAEVMVNPSTRAMTYHVTYSGLTGPATASHIHGPAAAGQNAPIVVPFPSAASPIQGTATLTPEQYAALKSGMYYVNVHTAANPGGEIRGQLTGR